MIELIATIILLGSLIGMGVILYRKIPDLKELKELEEEGGSKRVFGNFWLKIESSRFFKPDIYFDSTQHEFENLLQKLLLKIKVLMMKIENRISGYLQKLRERAQQRKKVNEDEYWQKLKKSVGFKRKKKNNSIDI